MTEVDRGVFFRAEGLSVGYRDRIVAEHADFFAQRGEVLILMGPNGAGKSTLLKTVAGQMLPIEGKLQLDGKDMTAFSATERARRVSSLFPSRNHTEHLSCREMVEMGRYPYTGHFGVLGESDHQAVEEAMELTDVKELADRDFMRLSDGQRQRVLLARAICQAPELLVLDEPTAFLDIRYQLEFLALLRSLCRKRQITAVLSVHEVELAWRAADRLLCVRGDAPVVFGRPDEVLQDDMLLRLFDIRPQRLAEEGQEALREYAESLGRRV